MKTYQVTLPDEFAAFADEMVASGKFESMDHLFLYAVAAAHSEVACDDLIDKDWLRKEIQIGIDRADRGEVAPLDMTAVWERVQRRLAGAEEMTDHERDALRKTLQSGVDQLDRGESVDGEEFMDQLLAKVLSAGQPA